MLFTFHTEKQIKMTRDLDFISLTIEKAIIHDLPKHYKKPKDDSLIEPKLSKQESKMAPLMRSFFKEKIVSALKSENAFRICYDQEQNSPISWYVGDIISNDDVFVEKSHLIANYLFEKQNGQNSGGILVIILCKLKDSKTCVVFKLDKEIGAQLTEDKETESYDIAEVQNLMLSNKTRIMKIAMLTIKENFHIDFDGLLVDYQSSIGNNKNLESYFMCDFLGCRAFEDPKTVTKKFYNFSKIFISQIPDQIKQAKYLIHLNSYMQSNETVLSPGDFADRFIETPQEKDDYRNFLLSKKFRIEGFQKNTYHIDKELSKVSIDFENGVTIIAKKKKALEDGVNIVKMDDGRHMATVTSKIKKVS
jgi:hypothetical protein